MDRKVAVALVAPLHASVTSPLSTELGARRARSLEKAFLQDMWTAIEAEPWTNGVLVTPELGNSWVPPGVPRERVWPIEAVGDVGHRLENLFARLDSIGKGALVMGGLTPGLPSGLWSAAREAIRSCDAVVGPSRDGGVYMLGFQRPTPGALQGLDWTADDLSVKLTARLRDAGLSVAILAPWIRISEAADLIEVRRAMVANDVTAPRARALLVSRPTLRDRVRDSLLDAWDRASGSWPRHDVPLAGVPRGS